MKAIKLSINKSSELYEISGVFGKITESTLEVVRTYPIIHEIKLAKIIARDIEDLYLKLFNKYIRLYERSEDFKELLDAIKKIISTQLPEISTNDLIEIEGPNTTYYLRRYLREYIEDRSKRDNRFSCMSVKATLSEIINCFKSIPTEYKMLCTESLDVLKLLVRYLPLAEYLPVRLFGSIKYTKQYVTHYLIESKSTMASIYFKAFFIKDGNIDNITGSGSYTPFVNMIEELLEDSIDDNANNIYRGLFNNKLVESEYSSTFDSLYIYVGRKIMVPALKEESYYLNKDYERFASLPDSFLLDDRIIVKESPTLKYHTLHLPMQIDLSFLSIGETYWSPEITTEGFLLSTTNLFAVNLDYIEENYTQNFSILSTVQEFVKMSSESVIVTRITRGMEKNADLRKMVEVLVKNNLSSSIYNYLVSGLRSNYEDSPAILNFINLLSSNLFGKRLQEGVQVNGII